MKLLYRIKNTLFVALYSIKKPCPSRVKHLIGLLLNTQRVGSEPVIVH